MTREEVAKSVVGLMASAVEDGKNVNPTLAAVVMAQLYAYQALERALHQFE